jgi:hypothetical protein
MKIHHYGCFLLTIWIALVGRNVLLLRLSSIVMWLAGVPAVYMLAKQMLGKRAGYLAVIILGLMPFGWVYPASFRWYAFFSFLSMWNTWAALCLADLCKGEQADGASRRRIGFASLYVVTGVAMLYTCYATPVYFLAHFLYLLAFHPRRFKALAVFAASWVIIGLAYVPWASAMISCLLKPGLAVHSLSMAAVSLYELVGTPFVSPGNLPVAAAVSAVGVAGAILTLRHHRATRFPLLILLVCLAPLAVTGRIMSKHIVMLLPLVAVCFAAGMLVAAKGRWIPWVRRLGAVALAVVVVGSIVSEIRFKDWVSYRWLTPIPQVLADVRAESPEGVVVTSSDGVMFYSGDDFGIQRDELGELPSGSKAPAAYFFRGKTPIPLDQYHKAIFIWQPGLAGSFSDAQDEIRSIFESRGFSLCKTASYLPMSDLLVKFHPGFAKHGANPLDTMQMVVLYFEKPAAPSQGATSAGAAL